MRAAAVHVEEPMHRARRTSYLVAYYRATRWRELHSSIWITAAKIIIFPSHPHSITSSSAPMINTDRSRTDHRSHRSPLYDICLPWADHFLIFSMYNLAHVAGWEPYHLLIYEVYCCSTRFWRWTCNIAIDRSCTSHNSQLQGRI